jgi:hypothetical protein
MQAAALTLRKPFDRFERGVAGRGDVPLLAAGVEILERDELAFEQRVEFLAVHVDLVGGILHEQQRGEFMRTQHRSLHETILPRHPTGGGRGGTTQKGVGVGKSGYRRRCARHASGNWSVAKRTLSSNTTPENFPFDNWPFEKRLGSDGEFLISLEVLRMQQRSLRRRIGPLVGDVDQRAGRCEYPGHFRRTRVNP